MEGADLQEVFQALRVVQETQEKIERLWEEGPLADPAALASFRERLADELAHLWILIGESNHSAGLQLCCSWPRQVSLLPSPTLSSACTTFRGAGASQPASLPHAHRCAVES